MADDCVGNPLHGKKQSDGDEESLKAFLASKTVQAPTRIMQATTPLTLDSCIGVFKNIPVLLSGD